MNNTCWFCRCCIDIVNIGGCYRWLLLSCLLILLLLCRCCACLVDYLLISPEDFVVWWLVLMIWLRALNEWFDVWNLLTWLYVWCFGWLIWLDGLVGWFDRVAWLGDLAAWFGGLVVWWGSVLPFALLYESPGRKPGWRFTVRFPYLRSGEHLASLSPHAHLVFCCLFSKISVNSIWRY